jgi:hypothetical protein
MKKASSSSAAKLYELYSLESVRYLAGNDLLLVTFSEIDSLHIVDNVSLSIRAVKHSQLAREEIWKNLSITENTLQLPALNLELSAQQLYDLIYKRKAGVTQRRDKLI